MNNFGWDLISVLSTDIINQQLQANFSQLLTSFSFTNEESATATSSIKGQFTSWQIVGGSNSDINVALTVASGTYSYTDTAAPQNNQQYSLAGMVITVEVEAAFLPAISGTQQQLQFNFTTTNGQTPGQGVSYVSSTLPAGSAIGAITQALIGDYMAQCLAQNGSQVSYVFALLSTAGEGGLPTLYNFGFTLLTLDNPAGSYFCILSTMESGTAPPITVDSSLVDGSATAYLDLSPGYFLQQVIEPQLPTTFGNGTTASSFQYIQGTSAPGAPPPCFIMNTESFNLNEVSYADLSYQPIATGLEISLNGALITTTLTGTCDILPGVSLSFTATSNSGVSVAAQGGVTIVADANPSISHSLNVDTGIIVVAALLAPIIAAIVAVIVDEVAKGIANGLNGEAGTLSLAQLTPSFLTWQNFQLSQLVSGGLETSFYLRGNS